MTSYSPAFMSRWWVGLSDRSVRGSSRAMSYTTTTTLIVGGCRGARLTRCNVAARVTG
jgi:hypothetical protein